MFPGISLAGANQGKAQHPAGFPDRIPASHGGRKCRRHPVVVNRAIGVAGDIQAAPRGVQVPCSTLSSGITGEY